MWIDDLFQTLTHPQVLPQVVQLVQRAQQPPTDPYAALREQLDAIQTAVSKPAQSGPNAARSVGSGVDDFGGTIGTVVQSPTVDVAAVRDQVVAQAATLKEALRFAREDGIQHPEAQQRVADVQRWAREQVPVLERYDLAPERLAQLPPDQQRLWEALLPQIRRVRQAALNDLGTTEGVTQTAALAGSLATALQTASVVGSVPTPPLAVDGAYSQYAPDMERDTGCIPCANAHLHAVGSVLGKAADVAEAGAFTDPQVQERLSFAQEELAALFAYDWTDEKIAASPPADKAILNEYAPQLQAIHRQLGQARDTATVRQLADQSRALLEQYDAAVAARPKSEPVFTQIATPTVPVTAAGSPKVRSERPWLLHQPDTADVVAITAPANTATAFDRLVQAVGDCGVRVLFRALPATPDYILEGQFDPDTGVIQLNPSALAKDGYALQTLVHEIFHSLVHNRQCLPTPPAEHGREELQTEDGTIVTMLRAGFPLETRDGGVMLPGSREIDLDALHHEWPGRDYDNLLWASDWMIAAMESGQAPVCQTCPVPQA